jgi:hypothetical protein
LETPDRPSPADGGPRKYIFWPQSPVDQIFSRRVVLTEGWLYLFQLHGVEPDRRVFMNRVTVERDEDLFFGRDVHVQRMTLGDPERWILAIRRPQMLVNLPGVYRFELENADMLGGDLTLEYSALRPRSMPGVVL